jgi:hypothetical protein
LDRLQGDFENDYKAMVKHRRADEWRTIFNGARAELEEARQ